MRVIIQGSWGPCVGTDYCDVLGIYESLECASAQADASQYAWDCWEGQQDDEDSDMYSDEGPDYWLEEYDPEKHDMLKSGGGSFEPEFDAMR